MSGDPTPGPRKGLGPELARALSAGLLAGLAAFLTDALLAWLTLGYPVPIRPHFVAWYLAAGALLAFAVAAGVRLCRRRAGVVELFAAAVALLYTPAVVERLEHFLSLRLRGVALALALTAAAAGYCLWLEGMRRVGGAVPGLLLAALAAAVGLALNRNLITLPTEPKALLADALVVLLAVALAAAARRVGGRRLALVLAAAAALAVALRAASPTPSFAAAEELPEAPAAAPNLLLVIVDTLREDVFRAVAAETEEGARFRRVLGDAFWFDNVTAAAPWTPPSVGSILTGLYPREHGFDRRQGSDSSRPLHRLAPTVTTLAEHLRARGFLTSAIATNPFLHPEAGIAQGFLGYEILQDGTAKLPLLTALRRADLFETELYQGAEWVRRRLRRQLGALERSERPFFLWLHLMDPHQPLRRHRGLNPDPAAAGLREKERLYRDEVRHALSELARMFELLESRGLWRDTAVVLVSDHGEMMLSDRRFLRGAGRREKVRRQGHGHALYRELVRVPLVIRPPGPDRALPEDRGKDREVGILASHVDLPHTITDLLGVDRMELPDDRVSLAPWLEPGRRALRLKNRRSWALIGAVQEPPEQRAVRDERFKLVEYPGGERPLELYDLTRDPGERRNLARRRRGVAARLRELLDRRWEELLPAPEAESLQIDEETRRRLEALGYL